MEKDGGPAFPRLSGLRDRDPGGRYYDAASAGGMSLRDWLAGQALHVAFSELTRRMGEGELAGFGWSAVAADAYSLADAMLAAREQK